MITLWLFMEETNNNVYEMSRLMSFWYEPSHNQNDYKANKGNYSSSCLTSDNWNSRKLELISSVQVSSSQWEPYVYFFLNLSKCFFGLQHKISQGENITILFMNSVSLEYVLWIVSRMSFTFIMSSIYWYSFFTFL